jgi:hypothetical protein
MAAKVTKLQNMEIDFADQILLLNIPFLKLGVIVCPNFHS